MKKFVKGCLCCMLLLSGCGKEPEPEIIEPPVEDEVKIDIVSNDIYLDPKNPSNVYAKAFNDLSASLDRKDGEEISSLLATCFAYDFYTLSNKEDENDVGGLTYLPDDRAEEFTAYAITHYYSNYSSIVEEYGAASLPNVVNVVVDKVVAKNVTYLQRIFPGYVVDLTLEYADTKMDKSNLKTKVSVTIIDYSSVHMIVAAV